MSEELIFAKNILVFSDALIGLTDIRVPPNTGVVRMDDKLLIRGDKKKFNLRNGMRSLRKKFGLPVVPKRIKGLKLPDDFYKMIDLDLVDTDRVGVFGTITKETLKRKVIEARDPAAAKAKLPAANIAATPKKNETRKH